LRELGSLFNEINSSGKPQAETRISADYNWNGLINGGGAGATSAFWL